MRSISKWCARDEQDIHGRERVPSGRDTSMLYRQLRRALQSARVTSGACGRRARRRVSWSDSLTSRGRGARSRSPTPPPAVSQTSTM